jgi:sugar phosphate isomerase/epimerase
MFKSLNGPMVGLKISLEETIRVAKAHGFEGIDSSVSDLKTYEEKNGQGSAKKIIAASGLKTGVIGSLLPGRLTVSEEEWNETLSRFHSAAVLAKEVGFTRSTIVMLPFHETLDFEKCFALCVKRLTQVSELFGQYGLSLGVEYVSQLTRRAGQPFEFIYNLKGTLKLLGAVNKTNVGLLLDSYHWFCASETKEDLTKLKASQIVAVHIADAPNKPFEKQIAIERELPGKGIADLKVFYAAVKSTGYTGGYAMEPFQKEFETMKSNEVAELVSKSLDTIK